MMLPSVPKSLGRLSDVFISALGAITGKHNRLSLPRVRNACVVLVDGLGTANLNYRSAHAPFLAGALKQNNSIACGFPSTTVASIASFATGLSAGSHGLIGYQIYDRQNKKPLNLLTGLSVVDAVELQNNQTVAELALDSNVQVYCVGPAEYEGSGFSVATMRGAKYVAAKTLSDRVAATQKILNSSQAALVYLYVPELDQTAHAHGAKSGQWVERLEDLDAAIKELVVGSSSKSGLLVTADHGIIDVASSKHIYLDEFAGLDGLVSVGGDPRVLFLYFEEPIADDLQTGLQDWLGKRVVVATKEQIIAAGWYGEVSDSIEKRMPELFLIAQGECAIYHRAFAKPKSLQMVGQHGGVSPDELNVPLMKFGAFSPRP